MRDKPKEAVINGKIEALSDTRESRLVLWPHIQLATKLDPLSWCDGDWCRGVPNGVKACAARSRLTKVTDRLITKRYPSSQEIVLQEGDVAPGEIILVRGFIEIFKVNFEVALIFSSGCSANKWLQGHEIRVLLLRRLPIAFNLPEKGHSLWCGSSVFYLITDVNEIVARSEYIFFLNGEFVRTI